MPHKSGALVVPLSLPVDSHPTPGGQRGSWTPPQIELKAVYTHGCWLQRGKLRVGKPCPPAVAGVRTQVPDSCALTISPILLQNESSQTQEMQHEGDTSQCSPTSFPLPHSGSTMANPSLVFAREISASLQQVPTRIIGPGV
ncbi:CD276 antigen-like protein [Platysternon megacephalum]|uniref:CD276 antigen-like protein n=1 Tax=Platysternon megacephalum TaxID=55544 RepID=A0A4D9DL40_9SAUR|nr:CD276 antigen-like protein [Platysternon megacephalum]